LRAPRNLRRRPLHHPSRQSRSTSRHQHAVSGRQPRLSASRAVSAFQYRWDPVTWVDATIAPDGTITGGAERITLVGKQTGTRIEGDVTNGNCGLHFTATKQS
jgi:hypothetical protein